MAATETITLNLQGNAIQQLQKLETQVGKVGSKFLGLRNILSGIALTSIISNTLKWADSIDDLSKATGLATNSVLGFSQALQLNGGDAEAAQTAMNKFVLSINEAAEGGLKSQQAFRDIGISLNDLATLSEQQLFDKVVSGLAGIQDKSKQAAIANEILGKSIRGVDFSKIADDYTKASAANKKYTDAVKRGADTQEQIEQAITNLKLALLTVLEPVGKLAKTINENAESFSKWIQVIWEVIKVLGSLFLVFKVFTAIKNGINVVRGLWYEWKQLRYALKEVQQQTPLTNKGIYEAIKGVEGFIKKHPDLAKFRDQFIKIRDGVKSATLAMLTFLGSVLGITEAYKKYQEVTESDNLREMTDYIEDLNNKSTEAWMAANKEAEAKREVVDANKKLNASIKEIRQNYEKNRKSTEASSAAEVGYAKMATDTAERFRASAEAYNKAIDAIDELKKKRDDLGKDNQDQIVLINKEIAAIYAQIPAAMEAASARVEALQEVKNAQDDLLKQTELMKQALDADVNIKQLQDQIVLLSSIGDELEDNQIIMEVSQQLEQTLIELRKQELDLIAKKGQLTDEQFQKELNQINALRMAASEKANKELDAKRTVKEAQRAADNDAILGIGKYLDELSKGVTPAKQALESVQTVFSGLDNALSTFIKTGKFKFKDFALSIIQDLIAIQAKAALVSIFTSASKSGGIIGSIFSALTGKASGGPVQGKTPYLVGEKGPELFVPQGAGTIVPNNQLNQKPTTTIINNYNVNAVDAKSVAQLFAENRKALLGASRMAEKEMPYMGR